MIIDAPSPDRIPELRTLWRQAFSDTDAFLDSFFKLGFSPDRCRCLTFDGRPAAALYWFDCTCGDQRLAYLYAVATHKDYQGRGLCRALMENTHEHLRASGYDAAVLVPGSDGLFRLYEKLGYRPLGSIREFRCTAAGSPIPLRQIGTGEYAALRRKYLPAGGVVQESETLTFLATQAAFYAGETFLLSATLEGSTLTAQELLGAPSAAPHILAALGAKQGRFRTPGTGKPFAMFHPLTASAQPPAYFGLALD